jgi:hypothetical protein
MKIQRTKEIKIMKLIVVLVALFLGYRTLYPAITHFEQGEYAKGVGYFIEFACVAFLLHNFGGLI